MLTHISVSVRWAGRMNPCYSVLNYNVKSLQTATTLGKAEGSSPTVGSRLFQLQCQQKKDDQSLLVLHSDFRLGDHLLPASPCLHLMTKQTP
ncbi:hypothetical protein PoB_002313700 [Plakobranchus ocellatus]|uniref:Uncharacterized protein n=1 Tax=Plakobranchus ocellatus TaxID=259542 RepID=A0AAV3ZN45_9GAST|nr:hypothetical protein PoB_002313700 [Plakobranchus ocellatus]